MHMVHSIVFHEFASVPCKVADRETASIFQTWAPSFLQYVFYHLRGENGPPGTFEDQVEVYAWREGKFVVCVCGDCRGVANSR